MAFTAAGRAEQEQKRNGARKPDADARATMVEAKAAPSVRTRQPRTGTKQAMLIAMLKRPVGATVPEIIAATNWLAHTIRGAMAGALKKKLGLQTTSEKVEGRGRVYRVG